MLSSVRQSESGSILILTVVMMTVLLGFTALVIDGSYMYEQRNRLAAAADAAAKGAAQELARNSNPVGLAARLQTFAEYEVVQNGFTLGGSLTVVVNHPPLNGAFTGDQKYVEVLVSRQTATFFARVIGFAALTPGARAVAGAGSSPLCIMALASTPLSGPQSLVIDLGNGVLGNAGCPVVANNSVHFNNGTSVTASPFVIPAGRSCGGPAAACAMVTVGGTPIVPDPLASLPAPPAPVGFPSPCPDFSSGAFNTTASTTMPAGGWQCYRNITFPSGCHLTFLPGKYYITGNWSIGNNCTLTGSGVFFYHAGASSTMTWGANTLGTFTAPTSGTYAGILFFLNRANSANGAFNLNNANLTWSGALYGQSATLSFGGASQAITDCSIVVSARIVFNNGGALKNGCAAYGGSVLSSLSAVAE